MAMKPISYEVNGFPEFLRSEAACQRVIERGLLKADMWVIAYGENNERKRMLASEHPLLRQLLGLDDTVRPAPELKGEPAPSVAEAPPPAVTVSVPAKPPRQKGTSEPSHPAPAKPAPPPPAAAAKAPLGPPSLANMTALERVIAEVEAANNKRSPWQVARIGALVATGLALLLALFFSVGSNSYETRFVTLDAQVRASPDMSASATGTLLRGDEVSVENDEDARWARITEGPLKGGFVPVGLLASESPPALDKAEAGRIRARQELVPRNVPDPNGIELERIAARQRVTVWGTVIGADGARWYLIAHVASNGMPQAAYIRRGGELRLPRKASIPIDSAPAEKNGAMPPKLANRKPAMTPIERDICADAEPGLPRMICGSKNLQALDRQLNVSWTAARDRFTLAGRQAEPLENVLSRIRSCSDEDCVRLSYQIEIAKLNRSAPTATPQRIRTVTRQPVPKGNPGNWISSSDYPTSALRERREGTISFRVTVGLDGRPTDCTVTQSSGHADLDATTCALIARRARFTPATDDYGEPMLGTFSNRVRWMVPG
jgi:TonB family protein